MVNFNMLRTAVVTALAFSSIAHGQEPPERKNVVRQVSTFGERPEFSPDGKRIAFIGKSYGDAYEFDLETSQIRNITAHFPHEGLLRVKHLENGDYLISGPRKFHGPNSRLDLEMFVLDRRTHGAPMPLNENVFEGTAVGPGNLVAWQHIPSGATLRQGESWMSAIGRIPLQHFVGRIVYEEGRPRIVEKRSILEDRPKGCDFAEFQDFRDSGREVTFYCKGYGVSASGQRVKMSGIYGINLSTGAYIPYKPMSELDVEIEGLSHDGTWAAIECARDALKSAAGTQGVCRLEMKANGKISPLVPPALAEENIEFSNPTVSPNGKSVAVQARSETGEPGEGSGIFLLPAAL